MTIELLAGEQRELNVELTPAAIFELIEDPYISGVGDVYLPYPFWTEAQPYDYFVGAELSVRWSRVTVLGNETTVKLELNLIDGSNAIAIASASRYWPLRYLTAAPSWYATLPDMLGTYQMMVRVYRDNVLTGQYPFSKTITIIPKGISNFSYTKPTWDIWWDASLFMWVWDTACTITNVGSSPESKNVVLWLRQRDHEVPATGWNENAWKRPYEFTLDLAPGESYAFYYKSYPNGVARISGSEYGLVQLRDSDGGVSPKSTEKKVVV